MHEEKKKMQKEEFERERAELLITVEQLKMEDEERAATQKKKHVELQDELQKNIAEVRESKKKDREEEREIELAQIAANMELMDRQDREREEAEKSRHDLINKRVQLLTETLKPVTWLELAAQDEKKFLALQEEDIKNKLEKEHQEAERRRQEAVENSQANYQAAIIRKGALQNAEVERKELGMTSLELGEEDAAVLQRQHELMHKQKEILDRQLQQREEVSGTQAEMPKREQEMNSSILKRLEEYEKKKQQQQRDAEAAAAAAQAARPPAVSSSPTQLHKQIMANKVKNPAALATTPAKPTTAHRTASPVKNPASPSMVHKARTPTPTAKPATGGSRPTTRTPTGSATSKKKPNVDKKGRPRTAVGKLAPMMPRVQAALASTL
eukprot:TRINITY_DN3533_c0_g1_i5.p1 TRINITY_DN3533_c0_g1~~TRINITY_DN3533_c0_g1_i5.p1  ORF type:complete len:384 (-),score=134.47 TRINITY_DN3533_c0_g1_i5:42-1193(-)